MKTFKILSIDACADGEDSWSWNNWFNVGKYYESEYGPLTEESLLKCIKDKCSYQGTLDEMKEQYEVDDDQYNLVLVRKSDGCPLYAIEYGSEV